MSTFLVQREFSHMYKAEKRKPLRVSEPVGIQRSSYFISLPLRYGIPLTASSTLLHWLISQSLFLARITAMKPDGSTDLTNSFSTCGYSPMAIIIGTLDFDFVPSFRPPKTKQDEKREIRVKESEANTHKHTHAPFFLFFLFCL